MLFEIPKYELGSAITEKSDFKRDIKLDWSRKIANLPQVWKVTKGKKVNVAILDSGIWKGWEKDPHFSEAIINARNFTSNDPHDFIDENGHGTVLASIVGARKKGGRLVGVAPKCNLIIGKIAKQKQYDSADLIAGLEWLESQEVDIVSLSLGSWCEDKKLYNSVRRLSEKGKLIICSAGNDKRPQRPNCNKKGPSTTLHYPAWYPETIAVGSIDRQLISSTPAEGDEIDFVAPGVGLYGMDKVGKVKPIQNGTSFAAAYLSGICALILGYQKSRKNFYQNKIQNIDQLRIYLKQMCCDVGYPGDDRKYGMGLPINWKIFNERVFIENLAKEDLTSSGLQKLIQFLIQ